MVSTYGDLTVFICITNYYFSLCVTVKIHHCTVNAEFLALFWMVICLIFRQRCVYLCVCVIDVESWLSCMNCRWLSRQHCHHVLVWPAWKALPIRRQTFVLMLLCFCVYSSPVFVPSVLWHCWLGGRKGIRLVRNRVVGCWHGYLSGARCRFAYGPADATATHSLLLQ